MDLVIHIGYRKTATSWLQEILFPSLSLNYIGKTEGNYPDWLIEWHYADDFFFDDRQNIIRKRLYSCLDKKRINLLSSEAFTNTASIYSQAHRIKKIWPEARIIITLRDPIDMIWSHYRHDIQEGDCFVNIEEWLDWKRTPFVIHKRKTIYLPDFFFDEAIKLYTSLFTDKNICILKYEDMISHKNNIFFIKLFEFLGIHDQMPSSKQLRKKINESPIEQGSLETLKRKNLEKFIHKHYPILSINDLSSSLNHPMELSRSSGIPSELREKLVNYFKGKSYGYY